MIMHALNLKVTYDCINKCPFCFSSYLKNHRIDLESQLAAVLEGRRNGCRSLVLSGGEPTLEFQKILTIIELADKIGYESYTIQTNGAGLVENDELGTFLEDLSTRKPVYIAFSIHGHTADIHNEMCGNPEAYRTVICALERIARMASIQIFTNTVISSLNKDSLINIVELLSKFDIAAMQFSLMHVQTASALDAGFLPSVTAARELLRLSDEKNIRTEGIPFCLMRGFEEHVGESYWPDCLDLFNKNEQYIPKFNLIRSGGRVKAPYCIECIMDEICAGVWREHYEQFQDCGQPVM